MVKKVLIDARGVDCPQPVVLTKNALSPEVAEVETIVDNAIAESNVARFMKQNGFEVTSGKHESYQGCFVLRGVRAEQIKNAPATTAKYVVLITRATLGGNDEQLGEVLIKSYLGALSQGEVIPSTVVMMNEGVKLALKGTSSCEHLENLSSKGTRLLVCGTCLKHFGITDEIGTGQVSNMFEISEHLASASHVVSL